MEKVLLGCWCVQGEIEQGGRFTMCEWLSEWVSVSEWVSEWVSGSVGRSVNWWVRNPAHEWVTELVS